MSVRMLAGLLEKPRCGAWHQDPGQRACFDGTKPFYAAENGHARQLAEQALFHADHLVGAVTHRHKPQKAATKNQAGVRTRKEGHASPR